MNPFEQMKLMEPGFTKTDKKVCACVLADVDAVVRGQATSLADEFGISQAALTRFCKKLGYQGFADFKAALYQAKKSDVFGESPTTIADTYAALMGKVPAALDQCNLAAILRIIKESRQVLTTGFHKSSLSAQLLAMNLSQLQYLSHFWSFDLLMSQAHTVGEKDAVVIFSVGSKVYREVIDQLVDREEGRRPKLVLVTMDARHTLRNKVDEVVWLPSAKNQKLAQYVENQTVFMVFCDLLTAALAKDEAT